MHTGSTRFARAAAIALALAASAPSVALGQDADDEPRAAPAPLPRDPAKAQQAADEARKLESAGKTDEACAAFARSQALDPLGPTLVLLALCHEKQGKLATAWSELVEAAALLAREKNADREAFARGRAKELEPRLSALVLEGVEGTSVETLTVDGQDLPKPAWARPIPLDAGEHTLVFGKVGAEPASATVRVPGGAAKVSYRVPTLAAAKVASLPGTTDPPYLGYGLAGAGVVGLGLGAVFGLSALSAGSDVKAACDAQKQCTAEGLKRLDEGRSAGTISTIGFVAGAALVTAGVVLVVLHKGGSPSRTRGAVELLLTGRGTF